MKINIFFNFVEGAWGGGNQFLKALSQQFINKGIYSTNPEKADIILFNSHHKLSDVIKLKYKYPNKKFIHRIDGPVNLIRDDNKKVDQKIYKICDMLADGIIFQSEWSKNKNIEQGLNVTQFDTTIINAPNSNIFFPNNSLNTDSNKLKLISTSWSSNINKGFDVYKYLDKNLDFNKYEYTFVGNSPIKFNNIQFIEPVESNKLAHILREHHIFITASKNDPCSNSLIEALHCGLPAIGLNDGGHPEIIKKGGLTYNEPDEISEKISQISNSYSEFKNLIDLPDINYVTDSYIKFFNQVNNNMNNPKSITFLQKIMNYIY